MPTECTLERFEFEAVARLASAERPSVSASSKPSS